MQQEKKIGILKKHYREYYKDSFPADRLDSVVNQALVIKEETDAIMSAMDEYAQLPTGSNVWVKTELPSKSGDYYCNCMIDGSPKKLIVEFDKNGRWGEAPGHDYYESFEIIEWLNEAPNEQPVSNNALNKDNARYELSLALRSLLKILKFAIGDDMTKYQKERYDAAEAMLIKHSKTTDVLRSESNEQPVVNAKWVKCGVATDPSKSGMYKVRSGVNDGEAEYNNFFGEWNAKWDEWLDEQPVEQKELQQLHADSSELISLRQSILESRLKEYFPSKEISFHDKVVLAIAALTEQKGDDAHEKEVMMKSFDKVRQIFEGRQWIMDGRGSYPYNDDRYREEVRYMYDEFDALVKDAWANIKSHSSEYRQAIVKEYLKGMEGKEREVGTVVNPVDFANWLLRYDFEAKYTKDGKVWICNRLYPDEQFTTDELYKKFNGW
jgi:hypothetical protein